MKKYNADILECLTAEVLAVERIRTIPVSKAIATEEFSLDAVQDVGRKIRSGWNGLVENVNRSRAWYKKLESVSKKLFKINQLTQVKIQSRITKLQPLAQIGKQYDINPPIRVDDIRDHLTPDNNSVIAAIQNILLVMDKSITHLDIFKKFIKEENLDDASMDKLLEDLDIRDMDLGGYRYNIDFEKRDITVEEEYFYMSQVETVDVPSAEFNDMVKGYKKRQKVYKDFYRDLSNFHPDFTKIQSQSQEEGVSIYNTLEAIEVYQTLLIDIPSRAIDMLFTLIDRIYVSYGMLIKQQSFLGFTGDLATRMDEVLTNGGDSGRFERIN
jgi:hypothetical protein